MELTDEERRQLAIAVEYRIAQVARIGAVIGSDETRGDEIKATVEEVTAHLVSAATKLGL